VSWAQFTDVLPLLTLVGGFLASQRIERRRERHDRNRIVLQRATDVEGEALLELQERLPELQVEWVDLLDRWARFVDQGGELDPEDAYEASVKAARPWLRARLLATRIEDDALRGRVEATIELVYPFRHQEVSKLLTGRTHPYDNYPCDEAQQAIADTNKEIGRQLREAAADAARRGG